ncbi:MAG: hypothetical protein JXA99_12305 [Candidatus Lokiarchaeota archaeon]|nr:hypothetical protein [Candidatus Lokiarchaeota archaeon]
MTLYYDDLKNLYEQYISKGRLPFTEIEQKFHLKREDVYPAIVKAIKIFEKDVKKHKN